MKNTTIFLSIFLFALLQISCNPECEPVFGLDVTPKFASPGSQVVISAQPISALSRGFEVSFNNQKVNSTYIDKVGLLVTVPPNTSERATLQISDSDCEQTLDFNVRDSEWFNNNPDFVFPSPPELILPSIPPSFPPALSNAWFSPQDLDYCIWFKMDCYTSNGECIESKTINPLNSAELSVCDTTNLYHNNPVFGILDKENNIVHYWVDRSNVNGVDLGIEEFVGQFIDIELSGFDDVSVPPCGSGWIIDKSSMILVTSQKTGKQLLMYRVDNNTFSVNCEIDPATGVCNE